MSNYHVYISIISKPRYTSTASCWFTIWKLNKLVVKTEFNSAFTKGATQAFICSRWLHNLSTGPTLRGAQAAPGVGPAREGHPEPLSTSHLPSPTSASPAPHSGQPQQSPPCSAWKPKPNPGLGESSLWDSKQQLRSKMWVPKIRDRAFYDQIYLIKFHCLLYCQSQWLPKETKHCTSTTRFLRFSQLVQIHGSHRALSLCAVTHEQWQDTAPALSPGVPGYCNALCVPCLCIHQHSLLLGQDKQPLN